MSLFFKGRTGGVEQRWIVYALLRDNIMHHLEGGAPSPKFALVHSITEALGGKTIKLNARALHDELSVARRGLAHLPLKQLAISARTLAVLNLVWPPPEQGETMLVDEHTGTVPLLELRGESLQAVFGTLMDELLTMTQKASAEDVVEVIDL